jgi:hypothetical protein
VPRIAPTPKGALQFIFPNGLILRFDLTPHSTPRTKGRTSIWKFLRDRTITYMCVDRTRDEATLMTYDFNMLEKRAQDLIQAGRARDAISIYLLMADEDLSLDGGYLGKRLAECYEAIGDLHAAKYWYGRAVEENPHARVDCAAARERLAGVTIDDLLVRPSRAAE